MTSHISSHTQRFGEYLAGASTRPLPEEVREKTAMHVVDTVAAMVSGALLPPGRRGIAYVAQVAGAGSWGSVVVGGGRCVDPSLAALANGMSAHADETDDSHAPSISHPGCAVVPAALAVADLRHSSGAALLRAVAAGYDVGPRVVLSLGQPRLNADRSGRSTHAFCGLFGAAATAASLYELDATAVRHVLAYAAQSASGVTTWLRDPSHVEKAFVFGGMPASNGVRAAAMVAAGCDGVDDVFGGVPNFLDAISSETDAAQLSDGLGERFEVMQTNIKKFAVGSPAQAAVQAMLEMSEAAPIDPAEVESIRIVLPHDLARVVDDRAMPDINCQYLVAGTLVDRSFTFAMAHDVDRMTDPVIAELRRRTELVVDPEKAGVRTADVTVTLRDGSERRQYVDAVRGTVDDPMSREEVHDKAVDLMAPVLGSARTDELLTLLWDLESCPDILEVTSYLEQAGGPARQEVAR